MLVALTLALALTAVVASLLVLQVALGWTPFASQGDAA